MEKNLKGNIEALEKLMESTDQLSENILYAR